MGRRDHSTLNLARCGAGDGLSDVYLLGAFEISEPLTAVSQEIRLGCRFFQNDCCGYFFSPCRVRSSKTYRFGYCRVCKQYLIYFPGRDFLAAAIDQFFDSRDQREIALGIEKSLIARAKPSIRK